MQILYWNLLDLNNRDEDLEKSERREEIENY